MNIHTGASHDVKLSDGSKLLKVNYSKIPDVVFVTPKSLWLIFGTHYYSQPGLTCDKDPFIGWKLGRLTSLKFYKQ